MIIYFEGVDGSGKSTLLQQISLMLKKENYEVIEDGNKLIPTHPKSENRISEENLYKELHRMAKSPKIYLLDRGPISDDVYRQFDKLPPVTRLVSIIDFVRLHNNSIFTIYCRTEKAEEYMRQRGDDNPVALKNHRAISEIYDIVMARYADQVKNVRVYDFTKTGEFTNLMSAIKIFCYKGVERYEQTNDEVRA